MELLAPVGNWSMLIVAIKAGCNAVYFGVQGFNMRAAADNFSLKEVKEVIKYCHENKIKAYCTVNTIILEEELAQLDQLLQELKKAQIDAVICWDMAVVKKCREKEIETHLSTQASVANSEAVKFWKELGIARIVLARECSLDDLKEIRKKTDIGIECFIHGARCISISGRCFLSQELFQKSANRGECLQPCRREYKIIDEEGKEMLVENNFILSAKDLCALPILQELVSLKIDSFKIEGRNRGADYVFRVVSTYRKAIEAIEKEQFTPGLINELTEELKKVYNKGFSQGFLADYPYHEKAAIHGSLAKEQKVLLGKVSNFYKKVSAAEFKVESDGFSVGDKLAFVGDSTGYVEEKVSDIRNEQGKIKKAEKGEIVTVALSSAVRANDQVYLLKERNLK